MKRFFLIAPILWLLACAPHEAISPPPQTCGPSALLRHVDLGPDATWEQVLLAEISGVPDSVRITVVYYMDRIPNAADLATIAAYSGAARENGHSWVDVTMTAGNIRHYVTEQALESVISTTIPEYICLEVDKTSLTAPALSGPSVP